MKFKNIIFLIIIAFACVFALVGCGEDPIDDGGDDKEYILNVSTFGNLEINEEKRLDIQVENINLADVSVISSDESIVSVSSEGIIKALKAGTVTITVKVNGHDELTKTFTITIKEETIELNIENYEYDYDEGASYELGLSSSNNASSLFKAGFNYSSSDEGIIKIDNDGKIETIGVGKATITVTSKLDSSKKYTFELEVKLDPLKVIESFNIEEPLYQEVKSFGNTEIKQMVKGSVNLYTPMDLNLIENIVPITNNSPYVGQTATEELLQKAENENKYVRSGILHTETTKITYHDTGNNNRGADAPMHARYMISEGNISARSRSWHYTVDENCAIHHIPDEEVSWQGDTYGSYSTSIGIETCVNEGSEFDITWHRTAKLMASLLKKHNMGFSDILQHYDWMGKNCPQTLRMNNLYPYAFSMIKAEYKVITLLDGYTIKFYSLNNDLVDDNGHIVNIPETATEVGYIVHIYNDKGYDAKKILYTTIPGLDGSKKDSNNNAKIKEAYAELIDINKDNYKSIFEKFNNLSVDEMLRATGHEYLVKEVDKLLSTDAALKKDLCISEVNMTNNTMYQYIELKNNSNETLKLEGYYLKYIEGEKEVTLKLNNKEFSKNTNIIIFGALNEDFEYNEKVLYPDLVVDYKFGASGTIKLYNANDELLDSVTYSSYLSRVGNSGVEADDFVSTVISPVNSRGEIYEVRSGVNDKVIATEVAILKIPSELVKNDETKALIDNAYALYNALGSKEKLKVRNFTNLKNIKAAYDAL
ncbi:MAG: N-acetylmuramoyl-L-alanine amidase [Bacilli bacterium]|nr:N-acetylmuramoyl-L-alanine amidase [Bacilli bacterium]